MFTRLGNFFEQWGESIWIATLETFQMVGIALVISVVIGLFLSVLLLLTRPGQRLANPIIYQILNIVINIIRSIPFIILLFLILPFTKFIIGTRIGVKGVLITIVSYTTTFIARLMETALLEVNRGVIEAYEAMGIKTPAIIWHVILREARPSIVLSLAIAAVGLIGATAMAGLVGAGGLGDLAYRYGFLRYEADVMYITVIILVILVQGLQSIGNRLAAKLKKD